MAKKGIKIKDLSRELGIASRVLVEFCREQGVSAQNSVARLTPAAERHIRASFPPANSTRDDDGAASHKD